MPIPRHLSYFRFLLVLPVLLCLGPVAHAQIPKGDVFVGFSRTGSDTFYPNVGGLNGWEAAVHFKTGHFLGFEGDLTHYGLGADSTVPRTTMVLVGPRITVGFAGVDIFGHGLVGGEHSSNSNRNLPISGGALAYALGGGLDFPLAPFFAWRIQGDRISAPTQSPSNGTHARFSTGIVLRF